MIDWFGRSAIIPKQGGAKIIGPLQMISISMGIVKVSADRGIIDQNGLSLERSGHYLRR
ncbi:hypothetical protein [Spirosoma pulveris]